MSRDFTPPSPEAVADIRAQAERRLSPEEFEAYVSAPMSAEEAQELDELIAWYRRRYPTAAARLRQARLAWQQWSRSMPLSE